MSIGQLAGTLLQDPLQSLFQQPTADPLTALLGGGLGGGGGLLGGTVDPSLSALLGGQLNPTGGGGLFGGTDPSSQLMMTLASLLLGNNSPLDQFPQITPNDNQGQQPNAPPAKARAVQAAPAAQPPPEPKPELPAVADKSSIKDGKVTLGKDVLEQVAKTPEKANDIIKGELSKMAGGKTEAWEIMNLFRTDNPVTHKHGGKEDELYKELVNKLSDAAVKQSEPFKAAIEQEKADKQAAAEAQAQADAQAQAQNQQQQDGQAVQAA